MNKKNTELPGFERPTIEDIDNACTAHQSCKEEYDKAKHAFDAAKEVCNHTLIVNLEKLEKDSKGNSIYVYRDGDLEVEYVIPCRGSMKTRKPTKPVDDSSDKSSGKEDDIG